MRIVVLALGLWCALLQGQPLGWPTAASTTLHFAQLADGGPPAGQKWTTTLILVNPSTQKAASVKVSFRKDDGQALALDFGAGAAADVTVQVPAGGTATMTSSGARATVEIGWATAVSDIPVLGNVMYRAMENGKPVWDVAAPGTGATFSYTSYGNQDLGVALANPDATRQARIGLLARNQAGQQVGTTIVTLAANGHTAFNLTGTIPGVTAGFNGSVTIVAANDPPQPFVAWSVNARDGLLGPLPAGEMAAPALPDRRLADAMANTRLGMNKVLETLRGMMVGHTPEAIAAHLATVTMVIDAGQTMTASYNPTEKKIHVSRALAEALASSEPGMAFLTGHYLLHAILAYTGWPPTALGLPDVETAGDTTAILASMKGGYDPSGIADFYGRVRYATLQGVPVDATFSSELQLTTMEARMTKAWQYVGIGCALTAGLTADCQWAHKLWHPSYPAQVP